MDTTVKPVYILTDALYAVLVSRCEALLSSSPPQIFMAFQEIFMREPTNRELSDFRLILQDLQQEKTGKTGEDKTTILRVIEKGGRNDYIWT